MKSKFFKPDYNKLLYFLSGVFVGLTRGAREYWIVLLALAFFAAYLPSWLASRNKK